jgi:hypothetical protein
MFAPKYVGISQEYIRDNPGYVLFSGVENVRPQISLGFPKDMLGIFHIKITHKHVTFDFENATPNGSSRSIRWHTMNELFKVYLMLGHFMNVYQQFKIPKRRGPHSSSTCCRIRWGIVATTAADNTAGRERCANTEISGIEVLHRENTYVIISRITCSRI